MTKVKSIMTNPLEPEEIKLVIQELEVVVNALTRLDPLGIKEVIEAKTSFNIALNIMKTTFQYPQN